MNDLLKLCLVLTSFLMVPLMHGFDGNPVGLTDSNGVEIVPVKYSQIQYVGRGLFLLREIDREDRFEYGSKRILVRNDGKEVMFSLPDWAELERVLWLGPSNLKSDRLPENSLLVISKGPQKLGICDAAGKIILPCEYSTINFSNDDKVLLNMNGPGKNPENYCFDTKEQRLIKLPDNRSVSFFAEGLAPCNSSSTTQMFGYVDKFGQWQISPQFIEAHPFMNNIASVCLRDGTWVTIDKSGRTISPPYMETFEFYGGFALARKREVNEKMTELFGVVDRTFKFVVPPQYEYLAPHSMKTYFSTAENPYDLQKYKAPPEFYLAMKPGSLRHFAVSPNGTELFIFPEDYKLSAICPEAIECYVGPLDQAGKGSLAYLSRDGKKISSPFKRKSPLTNVTFSELGPGRLLRTVTDKNEKFEPGYWKSKKYWPISRHEMFARFLKEHDLIGMSESDLDLYLGIDPRTKKLREMQRRAGMRMATNIEYHYQLDYGCVPDMCDSLSIKLENDKVVSWRIGHYGAEGQPITTNILLDLPKKD